MFRNYTHSEPRFRELLTEDGAKVLFHYDAGLNLQAFLDREGIMLH
jgi:hypothetical protein